MEMKIEVKKIVVLTHTGGTDEVTIHTNNPSPFPIMEEELILKFHTAPGTGMEYVNKNFPDQREIVEEINIGITGKKSISKNW